MYIKLLPVDSFSGVSKVPLVVTELQPLYLICSFLVEQFAGRHRMLLLVHPTERYRYCVKNWSIFIILKFSVCSPDWIFLPFHQLHLEPITVHAMLYYTTLAKNEVFVVASEFTDNSSNYFSMQLISQLAWRIYFTKPKHRKLPTFYLCEMVICVLLVLLMHFWHDKSLKMLHTWINKDFDHNSWKFQIQ